MLKASSIPIGRRIWLVIGLAILPLFILTVGDYLDARNEQLARYQEDARLILNGVQMVERTHRHHIESLLKTFAGADEMREHAPDACSQLAKRLMSADPNLANIGAATPDGNVFCNGLPLSGAVNVSDRRWFQEALKAQEMTPGEFMTGRISGKPTTVFGLPVRGENGNIRYALFASTTTAWFDRFTAIQTLPEGWTSLLVTLEGKALSRYPEPDKWRGRTLSEESLAKLEAALASGQEQVRMLGLDGVDRLFVLQPLEIAGNHLIATIGIPVGQTLAVVERQFAQRLLLVSLIAVISVLLANRLLGELIDRRFAQTLSELRNLKRALDDVPAYVFIKDINGRYVYANRSTLALFGIDREAIRGKSDADFFAPEGVECLRETDSRVMSGTSTNEIITELPSSAGKRYYHEIKTPIFDELSGQPQGLIGISSDITDRQLAVEKIRKLSRAIEQSPESIVFTNLNAEIEYVNDAFLKITGYSREEVIGQNPRILQSGKTPRECHLQMWEYLMRGETWSGEFINKRKDGSEYLESVLVSPVRDEQGKTTHFVAVKQEITERRRNEEELAEYRKNLEKLVEQRTYELAVAKEAAEAANRSKSSFLANMSHEIRTPLNAIIGLNHLLKNAPLPPEQKARTEKVDQAAHHLLQVINDILDLSRIEAGRIELEVHAFSPASLIDDVVTMIRERAVAKGLQLVIDKDSLPAMLDGDAMRLRQVLLNFAGNAVKFTEHGKIEIRGEVLDDDGENCLCRFSVRDTGIGIRPDQIPRLFHAFEQLDSSTTRQHGGSGLGLAIAKHLATLMGGDVGIESEPGIGSTFWITTRLHRTPDDSLTHEANLPAMRLHGRVLLVEDDIISREVGIDLLQAIGIEVLAVENGQLAVDAVKQRKFDLILMDVQMPVLDGLAATYAIRQFSDAATLPIVALTANAFASDRDRCFAAGMNDFLAKPFAASQLYALLGRFLTADTQSAVPDQQAAGALLVDKGLAAALSSMIDLMRVGNIDANSNFDRLRPSLQAFEPLGCKALASFLSVYDFEAAIPVAEKMLSELHDITPESQPDRLP